MGLRCVARACLIAAVMAAWISPGVFPADAKCRSMWVGTAMGLFVSRSTVVGLAKCAAWTAELVCQHVLSCAASTGGPGQNLKIAKCTHTSDGVEAVSWVLGINASCTVKHDMMLGEVCNGLETAAESKVFS